MPGARSWMPALMRRSYTSLKRLEQVLADAQSPEELCRGRAQVAADGRAGIHGASKRCPRTD